ncbi:conserved protein of unknown function [Tenacibaculum sp. 190130A14a]|uniref:Uncharacterized protein n=1 Tax=Tenacibaculum polynesiense TaxID=3137857 RepID=A0ABP1F226_9FLAO
MKFDPKKFSKNIESYYTTKYGAEIGEVFCDIIYRDKNETDFNNFKNEIKESDFFDLEKINIDSLKALDLDFAKKAIISSIIKECKYNEYFMTWNEGNKLATSFLKEFDNIQKIYTNSYWQVFFENNVHEDELNMTGWNNFSYNYWYDYGFLIVSDKKLGIIWFGDES